MIGRSGDRNPRMAIKVENYANYKLLTSFRKNLFEGFPADYCPVSQPTPTYSGTEHTYH